MWTTRKTTARILVWVAVLTVPVQGLPAATCASSDSITCSVMAARVCNCSAQRIESGRCCCAKRRQSGSGSCCQPARSESSSCSAEGVACKCGSPTDSTPATPPPLEGNPAEKLLSDSLDSAPATMAFLPQTADRPGDLACPATSLAARDRCISLCRFAL